MAERTCSIDGCDRAHLARGMCAKHYQADWYQRNKERLAEPRREYRAANAEALREYGAEWYRQNRERKCALNRAWAVAHKEEIAARARRWRAENPGLVLEYAAKRRAAVRGAWDEFVDRDLVWERDGGICHICGDPADPER